MTGYPVISNSYESSDFMERFERGFREQQENDEPTRREYERMFYDATVKKWTAYYASGCLAYQLFVASGKESLLRSFITTMLTGLVFMIPVMVIAHVVSFFFEDDRIYPIIKNKKWLIVLFAVPAAIMLYSYVSS